MSAIDDLVWLYDEDEEGPLEVTCSRCGTPGLHWLEVHGQWRLFTAGERLHDCNRKAWRTFATVLRQLKDGA